MSEVKQNNQPIPNTSTTEETQESKKRNALTTYFIYGEERLLAKMTPQGQMTRAYGWQPNGLWGTDPLWQALPTPGQTLARAQYHYMGTDHLGTPQVATIENGQKSWKGNSEAFGKTTPEMGSPLTQNLRFPGQYFDAETNLHQNYFRDYSPNLGRYIESDPIGLKGGVNLWGYVSQKPIVLFDPDGLVVFDANTCSKCDKDLFDDIEQDIKNKCAALATKVKNPILRACLQNKCNDSKVYCSSHACESSPFFLFTSKSIGGHTIEKEGAVVLCTTNKKAKGKFGNLFEHEASHLCGFPADHSSPGGAYDDIPGVGDGIVR